MAKQLPFGTLLVGETFTDEKGEVHIKLPRMGKMYTDAEYNAIKLGEPIVDKAMAYFERVDLVTVLTKNEYVAMTYS